MKLHEYMMTTGATQTDFARRLGVSQSYLSEILATERQSGRVRGRRPSPELAMRIVEVTGGQVSLNEALFPHLAVKSKDDGGSR
ncbi:MAG TPA: hypothetical protein PKG98_10665 [Myxococcota bacterium]|nr:hypothetical protein [Myxococcota bacterium]